MPNTELDREVLDWLVSFRAVGWPEWPYRDAVARALVGSPPALTELLRRVMARCPQNPSPDTPAGPSTPHS